MGRRGRRRPGLPAGMSAGDDLNTSARRHAWVKRHDAQTSRWLAADEALFLHQALSTPCLDVVNKATGAWIEDLAGRRYLDFHGNNVHHIGYGHPRLVEALKRQLDTLTFSPRRFTNTAAVALAEAMAAATPGYLDRCLFTPSGSDAVEVALRLARGVTGRHKTVSFWDSFHGAGFGAASVGGEAMFRSGPAAGPLLPGATHVPPPNCYRCPFGYSASGPGAADCCRISASLIRYALEREQDVAAVVATPMSPATWLPPPGFWQEVRDACDAHGALLIFDEVPTGLGKTGKMWAADHEGVVPDVLVTGKALGGGIVPLACVSTRAELDKLSDVSIGHYTHEKNPLLATAGRTVLEIIEEEGLVARAAALGQKAATLGAELQARHALVGEVRGVGLALGIELVRDRATRQPAAAEAEQVLYAALDRGLSFKVSMGSTLALSPPLVISEAELELAFEILDECLGGLAGR